MGIPIKILEQIAFFFVVGGNPEEEYSDAYYYRILQSKLNESITQPHQKTEAYQRKLILKFIKQARKLIENDEENIDLVVRVEGFINYCERLLSKSEVKTSEEEPTIAPSLESKTKMVINEIFETFDKNGFEYAFRSEEDYNLFTDLLTDFFEYTPYTLPEKTIQLKKNCKTKVAKALGDIHKNLSNTDTLRNDDEFYKLIRILSHFEKETQSDLYKALTR